MWPGLRGDAPEPRVDRGIAGEVEASLVGHVRIGVERDVGDRVAAADEVLEPIELLVHRRERRVASLAPLLGVGIVVDVAEHRAVPDDRDVRLVVVLLEEHPLQDACAVERVGGDEVRAFGEVPEDRARFGQMPAVVELEHRHTKRRVLVAEQRAAALLRARVHLDRLERDAELGQQQPNLVTVARRLRVVQEHVSAPKHALRTARVSRRLR